MIFYEFRIHAVPLRKKGYMKNIEVRFWRIYLFVSK